MTLPSFAKISLSVPLAVACGLNARIQQAKEDLRKLYLVLGGQRSAECYRKGDITFFRDEIKKLLESYFASVYDELFALNPGLRDYQEDYGLSVYQTIHYNFFAAEPRTPMLSVTLEVAVIFSLYANVLERLEEERPNIYPLIRTIYHLLDLVAPRTSAEDFYNIMQDNYEMDEAEGENSEEDVTDRLSNAEEEADKYKKHVMHMKGSYSTLLRKIKALHGETAWELTDQENWFVTTAIELFESWPKWDAKKVDILRDDEDRHSMDSFFNLLWDTDGVIQDEFECWGQDSGNMSAPSISFKIDTKKSLKAVKEAIRSFVLLEAVMSGGYLIWNAKR